MDILQSQVTITEQLIIGFLIAALFALLLRGALIAIDYAKTKAELITDEKARKIVLATLDDVETLIKKNISNAETTLKPAILQDIADGKVDKSELTSLSVIVKDNVLKQLSNDSNQVLTKAVGDVNSYLSVTIEDTLSSMKSDEDNTIITKTVIPEPSTEVSIETTPTISATDFEELQAKKLALEAQNTKLQSQLDLVTSALNPIV